MLSIDWKRGAASLNYPECYNNIRVVARHVKLELLNRNFNFTNSHLVGHSLGAHLMGYLAKEIQVQSINTLDNHKYINLIGTLHTHSDIRRLKTE